MHAKKVTERDYIKANRRGNREAEIENHSHPISFSRVHKSKKVYDCKRRRQMIKGICLHSFFLYGWHTDKAPKRNNQITIPCHF